MSDMFDDMFDSVDPFTDLTNNKKKYGLSYKEWTEKIFRIDSKYDKPQCHFCGVPTKENEFIPPTRRVHRVFFCSELCRDCFEQIICKGEYFCGNFSEWNRLGKEYYFANLHKYYKDKINQLKTIITDLENPNDIPLGYKIFPNNFYNSDDWARRRIQILTRDNYRCVYCGNLANHVDHLNSARYFPKMCLDPNNLRSTCEKCHNKRHNKEMF